ncbi:hypothetical protein [Streptomyces coerulescens]|uniref:Outer membrane channel protein CpnT-like N-terminal domain-containing protein n=1 Tax=Streptomyces coerulescens TaxID=29304 RepID=A0ABW0CVP1_STRCD
MSIEMPPELGWVAYLAVGESWPKGDEDKLRDLGAAWNEAARELRGISEQIGSSAGGVLASVGGQVAEEFRGFVSQLESSLPHLAESAGQLGTLGSNTALQIEYAKYMTLLQLVLLAAQIAHWAFFAPEVIPALVTSARVAIQMILRQLLIAIAIGVGANVGLDVAVQTLQILMGDRTEWSWENTGSAAASGAIGGAVGGVFFGGASVLVPNVANNLGGKLVLGGATGIVTAGITLAAFGGEQAYGAAVTAGALGAFEGGGRRRFGQGGTTQVDPIHVDLPDTPEFDVSDVTPGEGLPPPTALTAEPPPGDQQVSQDESGGTGDSRAIGTGGTPAAHEATDSTPATVDSGHSSGLPGFTTTLTDTSRQSAGQASGTSGRAFMTSGSSTETGATTTDRTGGTSSSPSPSASRVQTSTGASPGANSSPGAHASPSGSGAAHPVSTETNARPPAVGAQTAPSAMTLQAPGREGGTVSANAGPTTGGPTATANRTTGSGGFPSDSASALGRPSTETSASPAPVRSGATEPPRTESATPTPSRPVTATGPGPGGAESPSTSARPHPGSGAQTAPTAANSQAPVRTASASEPSASGGSTASVNRQASSGGSSSGAAALTGPPSTETSGSPTPVRTAATEPPPTEPATPTAHDTAETTSSAAPPKRLDEALAEHTQARRDLQRLEAGGSQVGKSVEARTKARAEMDAAELRVKESATALDDALDRDVTTGHLSQRELNQYVDQFAGSGDIERARTLQNHARKLDADARGLLNGPDRPDQVIWTGKEIENRSLALQRRAQQLEDLAKTGEKTPADLRSLAGDLTRSADELNAALQGFVTDAAQYGGTYTLRNQHTPVAAVARQLAERVDQAAQVAEPGTPIVLRGFRGIEESVADVRRLAGLVRRYRTDKAFAEVPTGQQWKAALPGEEGQWKAAFADFDKMSRAEQITFVRKLSEENIKDLRNEVRTLLDGMSRAEQEAFEALRDRLADLPYRIKHATPAYHAIANSGVMSSQGDLERRGVKFLASGKSSVKNTSNLGNDDFVFFRMEVGDQAMASRYGPTTLIFDAKVLEEQGGWVSLHDQLHPLDRQTMRRLDFNDKTVRSATYDEGFDEVGKRARWTYEYADGSVRKVSFEQEVFHGEHVREALALSVMREVARIGGDFKTDVFRLAGDLDNPQALGSIVSKLYRPEAKFGSGLPISPVGSKVGTGWPMPVKVVNEHGDGRYRPDGTVDPVARAAGKQFDEASDRVRQADNAIAAGQNKSVGYHLRKAQLHAQQSVDLTLEFHASARGDRKELEPAQALLDERRKLLGDITTRLRAPKPEPRPAATDTAGSGTPAAQGTTASPVEAPTQKLPPHLEAKLQRTLPKATPNMLQMVRVLANSGGFRELANSKDGSQTQRAVGLGRNAFDKAYKALKSANLVQGEDDGLRLTDTGYELLLPQQAKPETTPPVTATVTEGHMDPGHREQSFAQAQVSPSGQPKIPWAAPGGRSKRTREEADFERGESPPQQQQRVEKGQQATRATRSGKAGLSRSKGTAEEVGNPTLEFKSTYVGPKQQELGKAQEIGFRQTATLRRADGMTTSAADAYDFWQEVTDENIQVLAAANYVPKKSKRRWQVDGPFKPNYNNENIDISPGSISFKDWPGFSGTAKLTKGYWLSSYEVKFRWKVRLKQGGRFNANSGPFWTSEEMVHRVESEFDPENPADPARITVTTTGNRTWKVELPGHTSFAGPSRHSTDTGQGREDGREGTETASTVSRMVREIGGAEPKTPWAAPEGRLNPIPESVTESETSTAEQESSADQVNEPSLADQPVTAEVRELSEGEKRRLEIAVERHEVDAETIGYLFYGADKTAEVTNWIGEHRPWVNDRVLGQWVVGQNMSFKPGTLVALNKLTTSGAALQGDSLLYLGANSDVEHPLFTTSARRMVFVGVDTRNLNAETRSAHLETVVSVMRDNLGSYVMDGYTITTTEIVPGRVTRLTVDGTDGRSMLSIDYHAETYDEFCEAHPEAQFDLVMDKDSWLDTWAHESDRAIAPVIGGLLKDGGTWISGLKLDDRSRGPFTDLSVSGLAHYPWSGYEDLYLRQKDGTYTGPEPESEADKHINSTFGELMKASQYHFLDMGGPFGEQQYRNLVEEWDVLKYREPFDEPDTAAPLLPGLASKLADKIAAFGQQDGDFSAGRILNDLTRIVQDDPQTVSFTDADGSSAQSAKPAAQGMEENDASNGSITAGDPGAGGPARGADDLATTGDASRSEPVVRDRSHPLPGQDRGTGRSPEATANRAVTRQLVAADGRPGLDVLQVAGDGDCFFTSLLASAARERPESDVSFMTVGQLRAHAADWFAGSGLRDEQPMRMDPLEVLLGDLDTATLRQVLGVPLPSGSQHGDHLRTRLSEKLRGDGVAARWWWQRLLETAYPRWARTAPPLSEFIGATTTADLVERAIRDVRMWGTPFFDRALPAVARSIGLDVVVVQDGARDQHLAEGAPGPVYVHYNGTDHYSAVAVTAAPDTPAHSEPSPGPPPPAKALPAKDASGFPQTVGGHPWYVDHGALGDTEVGHVPEWTERRAAAWAKIVASHIEDPAIHDAVIPALTKILLSTNPDDWKDVLAKGQMLVVGKRLVWLKPVLTGVRPHVRSAAPATDAGTASGSDTGTDTGSAVPEKGIASAKVPAPPGWTPEGDRENRVGTQSTTRTGSKTTTSTVSVVAQTAVQLSVAQASAVTYLPQVTMTASDTQSRSAERTVKTVHRTHPEWKDFSAADAALRFRVFVDGEELKNAAVVERRLGVVFPPALSAGSAHVGALPDGTGRGQEADGEKQRPVRNPQYLNAIDTVPLIKDLHKRLLAGDLPAVTVRDVMTQLEPWLDENHLRRHSRWVLTNGLTTGPIEAPIPGRYKPFRASFVIKAGIEGLQFLGLSEPGPSRGLQGIATNNTAAKDGSSGTALSLGTLMSGLSHSGRGAAVTGRFPDVGITGTSTRSAGYSLSSTTTRHTEFKSGEPQITYAAGLGMSVSITSPTHPRIGEVSSTARSELGTMWRGREEAADFEQRVLGKVHTPEFLPMSNPDAQAARPRLLPGPVETHPHVRALLRESGTPLVQNEQRPPSSAKEPPSPHSKEPLALASRKGSGFAITLALPGAELVQDHFLAALKQDVTRHGDKVEDWTTVEKELATVFSRPALEQHLGRVMGGIRRTVWAGNQPYRLSVRGHLGERLPGDMSTTMEMESVVGAGGGVLGHRGNRWGIRGNLGFGLRARIGRWFSLHLGGVGVSAEYTRGKDISFVGGNKWSRRSKPKAGTDEHLYNITYELKLTALEAHGDWKEVLRKPQRRKAVPEPRGEGRNVLRKPRPRKTKTWWLDRPQEMVAQVVVPHAFVPRTPVTTEQTTRVGTAKQTRTWPAGPHLDFGKGGTAGVVPAFLPMPELTTMAAELYAELNGLPKEWAEDPELWPDEIHDLKDPALLESAFNAMVGRFGHEGELPNRMHWKQGFRLRLRSYEPENLGETPVGVDVVDTKEATTSQGLVQASTKELGVIGTIGGHATVTGGKHGPGGTDGPTADQKSAVGEAGRNLYLQGRGHLSKGWSRSEREEPGHLSRNKAIYKTSPHEVKSLPVFELTMWRWSGGREKAVKRCLSVEDGLQLLVPQRVLPDVMPNTGRESAPVSTGAPADEAAASAPAEARPTDEAAPSAPAEAPPAEETAGTALAEARPVRSDRDYLGSAIAAGIGRVERLRADQVMDTITARLQEHKVLRTHGPGLPDDSPRPDRFRRTLHQLFSSEALENQMPLLMGTGVWAWIPVPATAGTVSYVWVRVRAEELKPAHDQRSRSDTKLNVAVAATKNTRQDVGTSGSRGLDIHGRVGSGRGAVEANAGYRNTSSRNVSDANSESEIYDADPQDTLEEFNHEVVFRVELGRTRELPRVLQLPGTGVYHALLGMAHQVDSRERMAEILNTWGPLTWFEGGHQAEGDARILVPSHLTGLAGDRPVSPISREYGQEPRWVKHRPEPQLPAELRGRLHPLAVPAASAVERWAALAASTARKDPDLHAPEAWKVQGVDFRTTAGPAYADSTGTGMVKANIAALLGHSYQVRVDGRPVTVGFRLDAAWVVGPPQGFEYDVAAFSKDDPSTTYSESRSSGFSAGLGARTVSGAGTDPTIHPSAALSGGVIRSGGYAHKDADNDENPRTGKVKRSYRYYMFDLAVVFQGPQRTLEVKAPRGMFGMLPLGKDGKLLGGLETALPRLFGQNPDMDLAGPDESPHDATDDAKSSDREVTEPAPAQPETASAPPTVSATALGTTPGPDTSGVPTAEPGRSTGSGSSAPPNTVDASHATLPSGDTSLPRQSERPGPDSVFIGSVSFGEGETAAERPQQVAEIDRIALDVARMVMGDGLLRRVTVTGYGSGTMSGQPHFGQALEAGKQRARAVAERFSEQLGRHLADLGSILTASSFDIRSESRGQDLPEGTDNAHNAPENRGLVLITVRG